MILGYRSDVHRWPSKECGRNRRGSIGEDSKVDRHHKSQWSIGKKSSISGMDPTMWIESRPSQCVHVDGRDSRVSLLLTYIIYINLILELITVLSVQYKMVCRYTGTEQLVCVGCFELINYYISKKQPFG